MGTALCCVSTCFAGDQRIQCAASLDANFNFRALRQFAAGCGNRYT